MIFMLSLPSLSGGQGRKKQLNAASSAREAYDTVQQGNLKPRMCRGCPPMHTVQQYDGGSTPQTPCLGSLQLGSSGQEGLWPLQVKLLWCAAPAGVQPTATKKLDSPTLHYYFASS